MRFARRTVLQAAAAALVLPACQSALSSPPVVGTGPVATGPGGLRAELDVRAHRLTLVGPDGRRSVGGLGLEPGQLNGPAAVVSLGERFYVVERGNHRVQAFDARGRSVGVLTGPGLLYPAGLAVLGDRLLVADTGHARLVALDPRTGEGRVFAEGVFSAPSGLAVDAERVLVADAGLRQLLELDHAGRVIKTLGGEWAFPRAVVLDGDVTIVADPVANELVLLDRDGARQGTIALDRAPMWLSRGADGRLVVG